MEKFLDMADRGGVYSSDGGVTVGSSPLTHSWVAVVAVGDLVRSAAFTAWLTVNGVKFKQGVGKWQGEVERSFIIPVDEFADHDMSSWLAGQESVLLLGPAFRKGKLWGSREAFIIPVYNGYFSPLPFTDQYIGRYSWVGSTEPTGDWTYNPEAGFFAILPEVEEALSGPMGRVTDDPATSTPWPLGEEAFIPDAQADALWPRDSATHAGRHGDKFDVA